MKARPAPARGIESGSGWVDESSAAQSSRVVLWRPAQAPRTLPPLPAARIRASLLEVPGPRAGGGRLVVIGGIQDDGTPSDRVDLRDDAAQHWRDGPPSLQPGGAAYRMSTGRIVKLSLKGTLDEQGYQAEVLDAGLRRRPALPPPPPVPRKPGKGGNQGTHTRIFEVFAVGHRLIVLNDAADRRAIIWDDRQRRWLRSAPWPPSRGSIEHVIPLSGSRAILFDDFKFEVVDWPR